MSNPQKSDSGCFASVLRRLLCQGSLQTHPSDQITEVNKPEFKEQKEESKPEATIQAPGAPGIVARLMGLDSLPEANWVPKGKTPDLVTRSKSVNFMDYLLAVNAAESQQHRRVRTSVSFREVPTPLHQQNHDLFVMYLDEVNGEKKKMGSKVRKSAVNLGDLKQKKEEKSKNNKEYMRERSVMKKKENQVNSKKVSKFIDEPRRVSIKHCSKINSSKGAKDLGAVLPGKKYSNRESGVTLKKKSPVKPMHHKEITGKDSKKSQNQLVIEEVKPAEAECSSENSSPVSVLDVNDFSTYDDILLSEESRPFDLNSKWKSSLKTMNCDCPSPHFSQISSNNDLELRVTKKNNNESMENQFVNYYTELVGKLRKFTAEAIVQSYWRPEKALKFEDLEEMCMEFGQQILDILLQQVIDELVGFNIESCIL